MHATCRCMLNISSRIEWSEIQVRNTGLQQIPTKNTFKTFTGLNFVTWDYGPLYASVPWADKLTYVLNWSLLFDSQRNFCYHPPRGYHTENQLWGSCAGSYVYFFHSLKKGVTNIVNLWYSALDINDSRIKIAKDVIDIAARHCRLSLCISDTDSVPIHAHPPRVSNAVCNQASQHVFKSNPNCGLLFRPSFSCDLSRSKKETLRRVEWHWNSKQSLLTPTIIDAETSIKL